MKNMKNILLWIWIVLMIVLLYKCIHNKTKQIEGFTPKIRSFYRPHVRNLRISMETFNNYYPMDYFIKKFKGLGFY